MDLLRKEYAASSFRFNYPHQDVCYLPQWQTNKRLDTFYLMWRILNVGFFYAIMYASLSAARHIHIKHQHLVLCYFTFWIYVLNFVASIFCLVSVVLKYLDPFNERDHPIWYRLQWIIFTTCLDSTWAYTIGYIVLLHFYLHVPEDHQEKIHSDYVHLWSILVVTMDLMISSFPIKLFDIWPSFLFSLCYGIYALVYVLSGGKVLHGTYYMYETIGISHGPGLTTLGLLIEMVFVVCGRIIVYSLYRFRRYLFFKYFVANTQPVEINRFLH